MTPCMLKSSCENDIRHYRVYRSRNSATYICRVATSGGPGRAVQVVRRLFGLGRDAFALLDDGKFFFS